jgi:hypothetical protein
MATKPLPFRRCEETIKKPTSVPCHRPLKSIDPNEIGPDPDRANYPKRYKRLIPKDLWGNYDVPGWTANGIEPWGLQPDPIGSTGNLFFRGFFNLMLAIHRAEADMFSGSWHVWRATQQAGLKDGSLVPVIQGGLKRAQGLESVPLMQELVEDPRKKKIIEFISAGSAIGRALIAPPDVPADRIAALRGAFDKLVVDPTFLADAAKRTADIEPSPGAAVQGYSDTIARAPADIIEAAATAMAAEKKR